MSDAYEVTPGTRIKAISLGVWVLVADAALGVIARVGGCGPSVSMDAEVLRGLWTAPPACPGTELAGPSVVLRPAAHGGALFGLGGEAFAGFPGQLYALGLLALATVLHILVARWDDRSGGDGMALALVWAGAITEAVPRLLDDGRGLAEFDVFGAHTGLGELALLWGAVWLVVRRIAEARA